MLKWSLGAAAGQRAGCCSSELTLSERHQTKQSDISQVNILPGVELGDWRVTILLIVQRYHHAALRFLGKFVLKTCEA